MPQYKFAHPILVLFRLFAVLNLVTGLCLAIFLSLPVGAFCAASGLLFLISQFFAVRRRYYVDRYFRPPRNLRLSTYLLWRPQAQHYVNMASSTLAAGISYLAFGSGWSFVIAIIALNLTTTIILTAAIKGLIKYHFDWSFRIVVFRRNSPVGSLEHKKHVMPACGLFGQVLLFTDDNLSAAWEGGSSRIGQWVISEMYQPMFADPERDDWRAFVDLELRYADFAVLDWGGDVSPAMIWELEQTAAQLPLNRIWILASRESSRTVHQTLERIVLSPAAREKMIGIAPRDRMTQLLFIHDLEARMRSLGLMKRPAWRDPGSLE